MARKLIAFIALLFASTALAQVRINGQLFEIDGDVFINNGGNLINVNGDGGVTEKPVTKPDTAGDHTLELTDGSTVHGKLVSFGKNDLVWLRSDASEPLTFPTSDIRRIVLGRVIPITTETTNATLKLPGGDWLTGKLNSFADSKFAIDIGSGTTLSVERSLVEWMSLSPSPPDAFEGPRGPVGLAGWLPSIPDSWDYTDDSLVARQSSLISRKFDVLPDRMDIQFTAGDGGNQNRGLTLWIQPEGRSTGYGEGSVYLRFQGNSVSVNSYDGKEMKNMSGSFEQDNAKLDKVSRYRLLFDRMSGRLQIRINGVRAADWTLPMPMKSTPGGTLAFQPSYWSSEMAWTLSSVKVQPWDGEAVPDGDPDDAGKDIIKVASATRKSGTFEGLTADALRFSGKDIPIKDAIFLRFGHKKTAPPEGAIARVWLAQRGEFDVLGIGFKDGVLTARTAFSGDVALPLAALRLVEFPHRSRAGEAAADTLVFSNGDQLKGALVAAANDQRLRWKPVKGAEVQFEMKNLAGVQLAARGAQPALGGMAVRWQNGDWLPGSLIGLDGDKLAMRTALSEKTEIGRAGLAALYFSASEEPNVWDGASARDKWMEGAVAPGFWNANRNDKNATKKQNPWAYFDGSFTLPSAVRTNNGPNVGRSFEGLPDKCEVSFTLTSPGSVSSVVSHLFFDDNKPGIMVQSTGDFAYLYDMSPRVGRNLGNQQQQVEFGDASENILGQRRFTFYCDRLKGRFHMAVNGKLVGTLYQKGGNDSPKPGRGISINPQANGSSATISQLWIGPWTGALPPAAIKTAAKVDGRAQVEIQLEGVRPNPKKPEEKEEAKSPEVATEPPAVETPSDSIALANGDETRGTVTGATSDSITIDCDVGELAIPTKRATVVQFANTPAPAPAGVRLRLAGKGAVTVEKYRLENGRLICDSSQAGKFSIPLTQVSELIFAPDAGSPFEKKGGGKSSRSSIPGLQQILIR